MRLRRKINDLSIQKKLMLVFFVTTILVLAVNLFMYIDINAMMRRLDQIYVSNINLNSLSDMLDKVQNDMDNYLNTKTTDSMDAYYKSYQEYSSSLEDLSDQITGSEVQRMERNIRNMSEKYLGYTELAIEAKRGRNVEKYRYYNEEATTIYNYLKAYIGSLNMSQFKYNSTNYAAMSKALRYVEVVNIIVFLFVAFANVFLVLMVVRDITRPLTSLSEVANEVAAGNLDVDMLAVTSKDEIGVVSSAFNQMVVSIRNYIGRLRTSMDNERALKEKELKMETHLKDAQLKYLQAQINPHFLFNTLNTIASFTRTDPLRARELLREFSSFYRATLDNSGSLIPVSREVAQTKRYLTFEKARFGEDRVLATFDVSEDVEDTLVPAFVIQPIVENAVRHGMGDADALVIDVSVHQDGEDAILISVADNGVGMDQGTAARLFDERSARPDASSPQGGGAGVAMHNISERIHRFYGPHSYTRVESAPGKGTKVLLHLDLSESIFDIQE